MTRPASSGIRCHRRGKRTAPPGAARGERTWLVDRPHPPPETSSIWCIYSEPLSRVMARSCRRHPHRQCGLPFHLRVDQKVSAAQDWPAPINGRMIIPATSDCLTVLCIVHLLSNGIHDMSNTLVSFSVTGFQASEADWALERLASLPQVAWELPKSRRIGRVRHHYLRPSSGNNSLPRATSAKRKNGCGLENQTTTKLGGLSNENT